MVKRSVLLNSRRNDGWYPGSKALTPLSEFMGLPIDQTNFVFGLVASFFFSFIIRYVLHPSRVSPRVRHIACTGIGVTLGLMCWGIHIWHTVILATTCYLLLLWLSPRYSQRLVFIYSMAHLGVLHYLRLQHGYGTYTLDITGPFMIMTQKSTSLAFSYHDGVSVKEQQLTPEQKQRAVRKLPSVLEFISYLFHFQTILAGPGILYSDYMDFIHGRFVYNVEKNGAVNKDIHYRNEPSPTEAILMKLLLVACLVFVNLRIVPLFPIERLLDVDFVYNTGFLAKTAYIIAATSVTRFRYYFAWTMSDVVCNASGLGFNGFDKFGREKWDLTSNVYIFDFEFSLSFRDALQAWNTQTMTWLRMVAYDRAPFAKTLATYVLSAYWHGFYPGYYLTFGSGAIITLAARSVRRSVRPYFQKSKFTMLLYHVLTFSWCRLTMAYATFPFVLLQFWPSLHIYRCFYFYLHILAFLAAFILPIVLPPKRDRAKQQTEVNGNATE